MHFWCIKLDLQYTHWALAFWFHPERRWGYWNGVGEMAALGRAGGIDDGFTRVEGGRTVGFHKMNKV